MSYPWLESEVWFRVGGPPRALAASPDGKRICVGCQEGTAIVGPADPKQWRTNNKRLTPKGFHSSGIRSICVLPVAGGEAVSSWLVAHLNGDISWIQVQDGKFPTWELIHPTAAPDKDDLMYVGMLSETRVLAGHIGKDGESGCTKIYRLGWRVDGTPHLTLEREHQPRRLLAIVRQRSGWLLASHSGEIWHLDETLQDARQLPWDELSDHIIDHGIPQLIVDASPVWSDILGSAQPQELFVTTDVGIFVLVERETDGTLKTEARSLRRNGSRGTPMAVSQFVLGDKRHVWLSDSMGGVFIGSADPINEGALMARQMDARRPHAPAIRALAIESSGTAWIWQTCRDDTVGVATYVHKPAESLSAQRSIPDARRWIRDRYAVEGRARIAAEDHDQSIVTDLFDPPPHAARYLWEFLSHPSAELAIAVLDKLAKSQRAGAVRVWTQALVGSILRLQPEAKDNLALGVIQWLRDLEGSTRGRMDEVANAARERIFDVRRWTLFVPANEAPVVGVGRQVRELSGRNTEREKEEKLARAAILYRGRVDEEDSQEDSELVGARHPGTASSVLICASPPDGPAGTPDRSDPRAEGNIWAAVLWRDSEIAVFRIATGGTEARIETDVARHREPGDKCFGGGLAFWHDGAARLLVASVRPRAGVRDREVLKLFELRGDSLRPLEEVAAGAAEDDAIHAIVQLTANDFVVAGRFGMASGLKRLRVRRASRAWSMILDDRSVPLPPVYSAAHLRVLQAGEETGPASCIARYEVSPGTFVVAVGCADGQVFLSTASVSPAANAGSPGAARPLGAPVLVGRLAVPVGAIACRICDAPDGSAVSSKALRIYAGGSDGHVVAWQGDLGDTAAPPSEFAVLWATRERESIIGVHLTTLDLGEAFPVPVVVAVSRNGRVVLLSDEDGIQVPEPASPHPVWYGRPRMPGQRLDRYHIDDTPFAIAQLGIAPAAAGVTHKQYWPVMRLLAVTAQNRLRILSLYQPKRSNLRRAAFDDLLEMWREAISPFDGGLPGDGLRYPEALRAYAPEIWRLAIRTVLPISRGDTADDPIRSIPPENFPHSLRAFALATRTFQAAEGQLRVGEGRVEANKFVHQLAAALREAFDHRDRRLFKDINETVLKRFGQLLIEACEGKLQDAPGLFEMYIDSLRTMDRCCRLWLEADSQHYANVQISRIKHLVDGDVFRALTNRNGTSPGPVPSAALRLDVVRERVAHVHELLTDSHPLVPLEALRAVNHSLLRASWFALRRSDVIEPRESVLTLLGPFGAFASRAAATAQTALLHEITRCYAISLLAAPDAAVDVSLGLCKARVSRAILEQVREQLHLLRRWLLEAITDQAQREAETRTLAQAIHIFNSTIDEPPAIEWFDQTDHPGTARSRQWLDCYAPCRAIAEAIDQLVVALEKNPRVATLDALTATTLTDALSDHLGRTRAKKQEQALRGSRPAETTSVDLSPYFEAHYDFWLTALNKLRTIVGAQAENGTSHAVRPDIILASKRVATWAQEQRARLQELHAKQQLHEPHRTIYESVLERLKHTMNGLRSSAAVQRALVVGVLGHHMLESMDEQVFRLLELSHVLSPQFEWKRDRTEPDAHPGDSNHDRKDRSAGTEGTVERFAISLQRQAEQAGNAPKNLRTLFSILESMDDAPQGEAMDVLQDVAVRAMPGLRPLKGRHPLSKQESACLGIVFQELASNHEIHGDPDPGRTLSAQSHDGGITFTFPFKNQRSPGAAFRSEDTEDTMDRWSRIMELHKMNMQRFMAPALSEASSNGTGLYLAQLAAAVVGWHVRVLEPNGDRYRNGSKCWFDVCVEKAHPSAS